MCGRFTATSAFDVRAELLQHHGRQGDKGGSGALGEPEGAS